MRRFLLRWAFGLALFALLLALALRQWGGYWNIKHLAGPPPKVPGRTEEGEEQKKPEAPPVQGEVSEDTKKALEKHLEAQKQARRPPR